MWDYSVENSVTIKIDTIETINTIDRVVVRDMSGKISDIVKIHTIDTIGTFDRIFLVKS